MRPNSGCPDKYAIDPETDMRHSRFCKLVERRLHEVWRRRSSAPASRKPVTNRARGGVGDEVKEFAQPCRRRFPTRFSNKCLALYVRLWKAAPNEEPLPNVAFQAGLDKPMYRL